MPFFTARNKGEHQDADKACFVWAFGGAKGGSGKTQTAAAIGALLAGEGRDVVMLDANLEAPSLHTALGLKRPDRTLSDFFLGRARSLGEIITPSPMRGLRLIAGPADAAIPAHAKNAGIMKIKSGLRGIKCDALLIDLGPGTGSAVVDLFLAADTAALVTTPELASIELVYRLLRAVLYRRLKGMKGAARFGEFIDEQFSNPRRGNLVAIVERILDRIAQPDPRAAEAIAAELYGRGVKLVVNMARDHHDRILGPSIVDIVEKFYGFEAEYTGFIPFDERVAHSGRRGRPFIMDYPASETAACFGLIHRQLVEGIKENPQNAQLSLIRS